MNKSRKDIKRRRKSTRKERQLSRKAGRAVGMKVKRSTAAVRAAGGKEKNLQQQEEQLEGKTAIKSTAADSPLEVPERHQTAAGREAEGRN